MIREAAKMSQASILFGVIYEIVLFLLGALLILLAASHRLSISRSPLVWILLGILLIYWSVRTGMRTGQLANRWHEQLRAASFAIAGLVILNVAWLPYRDAPLALGIAGGVMAARGLLSAAAYARASLQATR